MRTLLAAVILPVLSVLLSSITVPKTSVTVLPDCTVLTDSGPTPAGPVPRTYGQCVQMGGRIDDHGGTGRRICTFHAVGRGAVKACIDAGGSVVVGDDFVNKKSMTSCSLSFKALYDIGCLRNRLRSGNSQEKIVAANVIKELGPPADAAVPELTAALYETPVVREAASEALGNLGDGVLLSMRGLLREKNVGIRTAALQVIASVCWKGSSSRAIFEAAHSVLHDSDSEIRYRAAFLASESSRPEHRSEAVPILLEELEVPCPSGCPIDSSERRWVTAVAMAHCGDDGRRALLASLKSRLPDVRYISAAALSGVCCRIPDPPFRTIIPVLIEGLCDTFLTAQHVSGKALSVADSDSLRAVIRADPEHFKTLLKRAVSRTQDTFVRSRAEDLLHMTDD